MVPGGGLLEISGVESGKAAPLVEGPPGVELHTVVDELPSGEAGDTVPVVLLRIGEAMVPSGVAGVIASDDIVVAVVPGTDAEAVLIAVDGAAKGIGAMVGDGRAGTAGGGTGMVEPGKTVKADVSGCWENVNGAIAIGGSADVVGAMETDGVVPMVVPVADVEGIVEITVAVGVPGVISSVGVEQLTTVPGVVGSEASGTGASVVSGVPDRVVAENGLGPLSGEVTIAPGVVARPMDVVPKVETCAMLAVQPASMVAIVSSSRRIRITPSRDSLACLIFPRWTHGHLAAVRQVDHRIEDHLIARLDAVVHLDFLAEVTRDRDLLQTRGTVLDHSDMQAILIEYDCVGGYDQRWRLARDK
jgi:hypothetical protein